MSLGHKSLLTFLFLLILPFTLDAAVIKLSGTYQGKNLFVQNPFLGNSGTFCTTSVYVNDKKVLSLPNTTAFEIDLSNLEMNSHVNIRIYHKDGCRPRVLNPQVIKSKSLFSFVRFDIDDERLFWETKGEQKNGKYLVQQYINGHWETIETVAGTGSLSEDFYEVEVKHYSGVNKYRLKYIEDGGLSFISQRVEYRSAKKPVTFYPRRVSDKINFVSEEPVLYEIHDMQNNKVMSGRAMVIDCSKLKGNEYYTLYFDNQMIRFLKKRR